MGEIYHYPLGGHDIEGLPQIAQYLAVTRQGAYLRKELYRYVYGRILEKYPDDVPDRLKGLKKQRYTLHWGVGFSNWGKNPRP